VTRQDGAPGGAAAGMVVRQPQPREAISMAQQHALRFCLTALYFSMMDAHALLLLLCLLACGTVFIL
jgi:hypothetical protein